MTISDLIDIYMFDYISTTHDTHLSQCGCCSMVEEMNEIRRKYLNKTPLKDIIKECICNRHGHQYCISKDAVNSATEALFRGKFIQDNCTEIPFIKENQKRYDLNECFNDFEELYDFIRFAIGGTTGIGPLTVYDTARRIGHLYKKPIYPKMYVYLAAGAKKGAENLLSNTDLHFREPIDLFKPYFGTMPSAFIEDMLCIYKNVLKNITTCSSREEIYKIVKPVFVYQGVNAI